jgi:hypothetical protein
MKTLATLVLTLALVLGVPTFSGSAAASEASLSPVEFAELAQELNLHNLSALDLINWKVGDTMTYAVSLGGMSLGNSTKSVTKDEGTAIWLKQEVKMMTQNEVIETLINKADGKVLKMLRNGQEQAIPNDPLEIISQDSATITVKAGTFQTIHIVAKTKQISKLEVWVNPRDTAIDGTVKQLVASQFGQIGMELTSFRRQP